jgi:hypothetical protein
MCPPNDHSPHDSAFEIAELLAAPPLSFAKLFEDPEVRSRIGFYISQAAARPRGRADRTGRSSTWRSWATGCAPFPKGYG